jgi:hypothetical protein
MRDPEAPPARRDAIHCKLAQVDATAQEKQNITGVRFWTEEEWLASRTAGENNSNLLTNDVSDAVAIDEQTE